MKILTSRQIRQADQFTIENEPIASIDLMERASLQCFKQLKKILNRQNTVKVFCGMGNNGGDGLAIARMLLKSNYKVEVFKLMHSENASEDFQINEKRLLSLKKVNFMEIHSSPEFPQIEKKDVIIDALFGSGLNRPLEGLPAQLVTHINACEAKVVSIDLPSGLFGEDNSGNNPKHIVKAQYTLSFQMPKLAFMFPENSEFLGNWTILDIGLHQDFIQQMDSPWSFVVAEDIKPLHKSRAKFSHKGTFGHALMVAGSKGKAGAAVLSAKAAVKSGLGLLTMHIPAVNYSVMQTAVPEAMASVDEQNDHVSYIKDTTPYKVVSFGPGLGMMQETQNLLKLCIQNASQPMVLDADALNILAENPTWLSFLPQGSILTPHPGEFIRLAGSFNNTYQALEAARDMAFKYGIFIVLKGAHTAVISPDRQVFFNSTGNSGMASGGSGDVLTGIITSLLSQSYSPLGSAIMGVYLHGLAADLAARKTGLEGLTASDIINYLPLAFKKSFGV